MISPLALAADSPAASARESIDKGVAFLRKAQQTDGSWQTSPRDPPGISALVLRALVQDPGTGTKSEAVLKGYKQLLSNQKPDGGIYADMLANYNTAIAISSLAAANNPEFKDEIDKAVKFLKGVQVKGDDSNPSVGGASYGAMKPGGKPPRADLSNTQMFIEALKDAGLKEDDPAFKDAIKFVSRTQNRSETNDQKWAGEDGGFVYTPADGGSSNAGEYTGPDGKRLLRSYGLMTYAGLKSMIYAGLTKDDPRVKAAWDWITKNWSLDENPGMKFAGPEKATSGMYYYYHTLATALAAYDEPVITDPKGNKHDWRVEFIAKVASLQKPDGSWIGDKAWMENNPVLATTFVVLSLQAVEKDLQEHPAK
ncbi:terpene cyclase/mutase family protein [Humisphaera borealis]|uniref:Terpene cyclase/mutase family protein n=2 Tax=Humisphaera borealis TaxID=2807512 RepID=A0A7M2WRP9_9BACT|nr:terpene cyclase/mutase family protein [Humisphaera borealis]